ncbi:ABC transporter ATP-binding protein [Candidatus Marinimicrobia bacterium]|nr:ABC transporter ATP-binding protein [Candidatus Neomarinimicrobiota bacterium]
MSNIAIRVENLSKRYRIGLKEETNDTFVGAVGSVLKSPFQNLKRIQKLTHFKNGQQSAEDIIWALKEVSFEVKKGEIIGIIGRNGAGKSTLLKILAQITHPTSGKAELNGRVASLLEVGTGFHPELTGRENIYLNGTILGMTKKEIDFKLGEIVDFSGVEKFMDTPVKRYSSGMRVRLAFSVAAHLDPEILLIDEVLAVGDAEFQKKCLGKMDEVAKSGRTVLFVSHNLVALKNICSSGIYIDSGSLVNTADISDVISNYRENLLLIKNNKDSMTITREGNGKVRIIGITVKSNSRNNHLLSGCEANYIINLNVFKPCNNCYLILTIIDTNDIIRFVSNTLVMTNKFFNLINNSSLSFTIEDLPLPEGDYYYHLKLNSNNEIVDKINYGGKFHVYPGDFFNSGRIPNSKDGLLIKGIWNFNE